MVLYVQNADWKTELRAARSSVWDVTELRPDSCWKWTQARERVDCASMKRQEIHIQVVIIAREQEITSNGSE